MWKSMTHPLMETPALAAWLWMATPSVVVMVQRYSILPLACLPLSLPCAFHRSSVVIPSLTIVTEVEPALYVKGPSGLSLW